jgi:hypothetical protein
MNFTEVDTLPVLNDSQVEALQGIFDRTTQMQILKDKFAALVDEQVEAVKSWADSDAPKHFVYTHDNQIIVGEFCKCDGLPAVQLVRIPTL